MNLHERRRRLNDIAHLATDAQRHLPATIHAITDQLAGHPRATRTDGQPGRATTVYCETHEQDACPCGQSTSYPAIVDPTGETAMHPDPAAHALNRLDKALATAHAAMTTLNVIITAHRPHAPSTEHLAALNGQGDPGCQSCARTGRWSPPHVEHSTCKGNLPTPMRLCTWCHHWTITVGHLPTRKQLEAHHNGRKIRRPA